MNVQQHQHVLISVVCSFLKSALLSLPLASLPNATVIPCLGMLPGHTCHDLMMPFVASPGMMFAAATASPSPLRRLSWGRSASVPHWRRCWHQHCSHEATSLSSCCSPSRRWAPGGPGGGREEDSHASSGHVTIDWPDCISMPTQTNVSQILSKSPRLLQSRVICHGSDQDRP
jgi:hypothetical protein